MKTQSLKIKMNHFYYLFFFILGIICIGLFFVPIISKFPLFEYGLNLYTINSFTGYNEIRGIAIGIIQLFFICIVTLFLFIGFILFVREYNHTNTKPEVKSNSAKLISIGVICLFLFFILEIFMIIVIKQFNEFYFTSIGTKLTFGPGSFILLAFLLIAIIVYVFYEIIQRNKTQKVNTIQEKAEN